MTEFRFLADTDFELREDAGSTPVLVGYAARFWDGTPETQFQLRAGVYERVMPGAFDNIAANDVISSFNHNFASLLGRTSNKTLRLSVDSRGLRYEVDLPDTSAGRDVAALVKRGDLKGSSFAFKVERDTITKDGENRVRSLNSVRVAELGPVVNPAYTGTSTGIRSEELDALEARFAELDVPEVKTDFVAAARLRLDLISRNI